MISRLGLKLFKILLITTFLCCSSDDDNNIDVTELSITISSEDTYEYDLGFFQTEEGASINSQADHFEISFIERDESNDRIYYYYKADDGYRGNDSVELTAYRRLDGSTFTDFNRTIISFTVTD